MTVVDTITISELNTMALPFTIDRQRWQLLTIFEQIGNSGSDVGYSFTH
jgi:hypothetical protein